MYNENARTRHSGPAQRYGPHYDQISDEIFYEYYAARYVLTEVAVSWQAYETLEKHDFRPHPSVGEEGLLGPSEKARWIACYERRQPLRASWARGGGQPTATTTSGTAGRGP